MKTRRQTGSESVFDVLCLGNHGEQGHAGPRKEQAGVAEPNK
jgi:hypothetical protein